jgi:oligopeptide/dipeptide ABC transporter ATP-binding protein
MAGSGTAHLRPENETLLRVENLVVEFPVGRSGLRVHAVSDVSLDIKEGETLGLVGESGCGKSTTGKAIMQLPRPKSGKVQFEGDDLTTLSGEDLRRTRTRMKMIFQDPISSLNPRRKVEDIVAEGLRIWQEMDRPAVRRSFNLSLAAFFAFAAAVALGLVALMVVGFAIFAHLSILERIGFLVLAGFAVMFGLLFRTAGVDLWNVRRTGWTLSLMLWGAALVVNLFIALSGGGITWATVIFEAAVIALLLLPASTKAFPRDPPGLQEKVDAMMVDVGLDPAFQRGRRPFQFSGGQCQRISIARAVVTDPKLIICDEPVSALDVSVQAQILNLLEDMKARYGLTLIFIAHDLAVVKNVSDRVVVMYLGKVCEVGDPDTLFRQPAHPYTAALLAAIPVPDPSQRPEERMHLGGEIPSPVAPPSGCRFRTRCPKAQEQCAAVEPEVREIAPGQFVACHFPLAAGEALPGRNGQTAAAT